MSPRLERMAACFWSVFRPLPNPPAVDRLLAAIERQEAASERLVTVASRAAVIDDLVESR